MDKSTQMSLRLYRFRLNIGWITALTGFRFSSSYRHGVTWKHRVVYALIDTIGSNITASGRAAQFQKWRHNQ